MPQNMMAGMMGGGPGAGSDEDMALYQGAEGPETAASAGATIPKNQLPAGTTVGTTLVVTEDLGDSFRVEPSESPSAGEEGTTVPSSGEEELY